MNTYRLKAMAKINLGLDVLRRRPDGYHEVRMVMQMINLYDQISVERIPEPEIRIKTNLPFLPVDEHNIAYKAARLMRSEFNLEDGVAMNIDKHIPVAAGMAGGSTDCAAVLYAMNKLYDLRLSTEALMKLGVRLGADVPFCILGQTALSEGIGEQLTVVDPMPDCYLLIAKPGISVSTKYVYEHLQLNEETVHPDIDGILVALKEKDLEGVVSRLGNVLETVTEKEHPVITQIKELMVKYGAMGALMSGSGPTVFGVFDDEEKARIACTAMKDSRLAKQVFLTRPFERYARRKSGK